MIPQGQIVANSVLWQVKAGSCTLQTLHQEVDDPCSLVTADDPCSLVTTGKTRYLLVHIGIHSLLYMLQLCVFTVGIEGANNGYGSSYI